MNAGYYDQQNISVLGKNVLERLLSWPHMPVAIA
jgi:hypothetical protein